MSWQGRQLASATKDGKSLSYTYNSDGIRTGKTVNGVKTEYLLNGTQILAQKTGNDVMWFFYDQQGNRVGMADSSNHIYYYLYNLQGDVIALADAETGKLAATYTYDAWGKIVSVKNASGYTIGTANPFRYRGYYYDTETGLYYLNSRYYNPEIGRFLNEDNQFSTGGNLTGLNLFTYCGNNPVNRIDPTGEAWWHWALGAAVVVACAAATVVTCGGFAAAATAVCLVGNGVAAGTTASTVAAAAFIGSASIYGTAALTAASDSRSVKEFNDKGNWGTVAVTAGGAILGAGSAYFSTKNTPQAVNNTYNLNGSKDSNYVSKRGWNSDMISNAINNGKQGTSVNIANGAPCTAYCYPGTNNQYVVIENESRSIVQVSNFYDSGWIPDQRIVWDP